MSEESMTMLPPKQLDSFDFYDLRSLERAITYVFDAGRTPEAIELSWSDWSRLENFAHGLGSHPCFIRWPIERSDRPTGSFIRCEERLT